jgi:Zn-dependent protease
MPQEFYRSLQTNSEGTSEHSGQMIDYAHPDYYQSLDSADNEASRGSVPIYALGEATVPPNYNDYTHPSHYGVFPYGGNQAQESYTPASIEWNPGDEERGEAPQWQQEKVKSGRKRGGLAGLGALAATVGGWLLKLKSLALLLKFGTAGFTALISVAFYSISFGWAFAFGFVGLIFLHEMGHVIAVKLKGLPVNGMFFIPFFGAAVSWSSAKNIKDEAEVAIAGPLAGAIASAICLGIVLLFNLQDTLWLPLAYMGFFLNLINLAPVWPLDGGRVFDAINRRVWIIGFIGLLGLQIWAWLQGNPSLWLLFLLILAGSRLLTNKQTTDNAAYYEIATSARIKLTAMYFALVIVLFLGMFFTHSLMGIGF